MAFFFFSTLLLFAGVALLSLALTMTLFTLWLGQMQSTPLQHASGFCRVKGRISAGDGDEPLTGQASGAPSVAVHFEVFKNEKGNWSTLVDDARRLDTAVLSGKSGKIEIDLARALLALPEEDDQRSGSFHSSAQHVTRLLDGYGIDTQLMAETLRWNEAGIDDGKGVYVLGWVSDGRMGFGPLPAIVSAQGKDVFMRRAGILTAGAWGATFLVMLLFGALSICL